MRHLRIVALLAALALAAGAIAGCGGDDDDDESSEASVEEVTLTADDAGGDYTFELSDTPTADTESVVFDNQGEQPHVMIFARINEGYTVDVAFELEGRKGSAETVAEADAAPGKSKTVPIEGPIEPGSYAMLCPIPGPGGEPHYKLGQLEEFEVE